MRSKIDQSDPNPAHKLQRSVEDLTIDSKQGREINPRFSGSKFSKPRPVFRRGGTVDSSGIPPSASQPEYCYQRSASVDTPTGPVLASSFPVRRERASKMSRIVEKQPPMPASHDVFEESEEDELLGGARVSHEQVCRRKNAGSTAFAESALAEDAEGLVGGDFGIYGMEVTSNSTETTVVLKHLLALAGKGSAQSSDMAIIEEDELEDEEDFYESQDPPIVGSSSHGSFFLPHPIPQLIVSDDEGELVETIVEKTRYYTPDPFADYGVTQSRFPFAVEEEDEEDEEGLLFTRL